MLTEGTTQGEGKEGTGWLALATWKKEEEEERDEYQEENGFRREERRIYSLILSWGE